ncbi:MAG TPA: hypothetical protein VFZ58_03630 [Candidatus Saccharimonadales bacterium]
MELSKHIKQWVSSIYFALGLSLVSMCVVVTIFVSASPASLGVNGMLFAFGVFYIFFFSIALLLLHIFQRIFIHDRVKNRENGSFKSPHHISIGKQSSLSAAVAFAPVTLIALRSIGQLDMTSMILVALFEAGAIFYILKR